MLDLLIKNLKVVKGLDSANEWRVHREWLEVLSYYFSPRMTLMFLYKIYTQSRIYTY